MKKESFIAEINRIEWLKNLNTKTRFSDLK